MRPTLLPGDRLLIARWGRPRRTELVVVEDPRRAGRLMVKRVAAVRERQVTVLGDNPAASTDSRMLGPLSSVWGRPIYRYSPRHRAGAVGSIGPGRRRTGTRPPRPRAVASRVVDNLNLALARVLAPEYLDGLEQMPLSELRARKMDCAEVEWAVSCLRKMVQGRLDIVLAELQRRADGGEGDLSDLVDQLPEILSERGRGSGGRMLPFIAPDVNYRRLTAELDRIIDADKVGALTQMNDDEVRAIVDGLVEYEHRVSAGRRALHERLDTIQAEIVRRYKSGGASVDGLLS